MVREDVREVQSGRAHKGKIHEYLDMVVDFTEHVVVKIDMVKYVEGMLNDFPTKIVKVSKTPAADNLLDIGTGSGCIAIALAKNTTAQIAAIDNCEKALEVAKENAKLNKVNIKFCKQDILQSTSLLNLDIIVSNPPYALNSEKEVINKNVLNW